MFFCKIGVKTQTREKGSKNKRNSVLVSLLFSLFNMFFLSTLYFERSYAVPTLNDALLFYAKGVVRIFSFYAFYLFIMLTLSGATPVVS